MDKVGASNQPIYSLGIGSKPATAEENNLEKPALLAALEKRLKESDHPEYPYDIRISANKKLSVDQVQDLMDELEKRKNMGCKIATIKAETADKQSGG